LKKIRQRQLKTRQHGAAVQDAAFVDHRHLGWAGERARRSRFRIDLPDKLHAGLKVATELVLHLPFGIRFR
jgi:hypothetical protein